MGMIVNGVYIRGKANMQQLQSRQSSTWKRWSHNSQRGDYAAEIIQPRDRKGHPNQAFIEVYPEDAVDYGFVPSQAEIIGKDSGTEPLPDMGAQYLGADDDRLIAEIPMEEY
jgi:hypothetical protein